MAKKHISKRELKAKALELCREVEATGESIIVTDYGRPTVELRPYHDPKSNPLETLKGKVLKYVDPTAPVSEADWDVLRG